MATIAAILIIPEAAGARQMGEVRQVEPVEQYKPLEPRVLPGAKPRAIARESAHDEMIEYSKNDLKRKLKDPYSAQFSELKVYGDASLLFLCGLVNAKNSYGGYSGYRPFSVVTTNAGGKFTSISNIMSDEDAKRSVRDARYAALMPNATCEMTAKKFPEIR